MREMGTRSQLSSMTNITGAWNRCMASSLYLVEVPSLDRQCCYGADPFSCLDNVYLLHGPPLLVATLNEGIISVLPPLRMLNFFKYSPRCP